MADKYTITLLRDNELKYIVYVENKEGHRYDHRCFTAEEIDKRFLLRKDTSYTTGKIFGIADDLEGVDKRLCKSARIQVQKFKKTYKELGEIEVIDKTKKEKSIESRL